MSVLKIIGLIVSIGLLALAAFLAQTPWRAHGGRFVTEYMIVAGPIAIAGLVILGLALL